MNVNNISITDVKVDAATNALVSITLAHHEIHEGCAFSVHIDNTTANSGDDRTLLGFECPGDASWAHLTVQASASNAAEVFLYEDVTIDDDEGTEIPIEDRNRNTGNTSTMLSFGNPAVAGLATWMNESEVNLANFSAATILDHFQLVAGAGPKAVGGDQRAEQEWVLKQGLKYAVVIQNIGATVNLHEIHLEFYEHTDVG